MSNKSIKDLNLSVLQRSDSAIEEIVHRVAHVVVYKFDQDSESWAKCDVEGSAFVVRRSSRPMYQIIVMNRQQPDNFVESIQPPGQGLPESECEVQVPYVFFRNGSERVHGLWFFNPVECIAFGDLLHKIMSGSPLSPSERSSAPSPPVEKLFEQMSAIALKSPEKGATTTGKRRGSGGPSNFASPTQAQSTQSKGAFTSPSRASKPSKSPAPAPVPTLNNSQGPADPPVVNGSGSRTAAARSLLNQFSSAPQPSEPEPETNQNQNQNFNSQSQQITFSNSEDFFRAFVGMQKEREQEVFMYNPPEQQIATTSPLPPQLFQPQNFPTALSTSATPETSKTKATDILLRQLFGLPTSSSDMHSPASTQGDSNIPPFIGLLAPSDFNTNNNKIEGGSFDATKLFLQPQAPPPPAVTNSNSQPTQLFFFPNPALAETSTLLKPTDFEQQFASETQSNLPVLLTPTFLESALKIQSTPASTNLLLPTIMPQQPQPQQPSLLSPEMVAQALQIHYPLLQKCDSNISKHEIKSLLGACMEDDSFLEKLQSILCRGLGGAQF